MPEFSDAKPLGFVLQEASLISSSQIQVALHDQTYYENLKIGEILALRGWLEQKTADFFAEDWSPLIKQVEKHPLGYYLQRAALLTEYQVQSILDEQQQAWIKFGSVAVIRGWIKDTTLEFFLHNLFPNISLKSNFREKHLTLHDYPHSQFHEQPTVIENKHPQQAQEVEIDYEDIPWID